MSAAVIRGIPKGAVPCPASVGTTPESGSVQTPSVQTRPPLQSFERVHGAFTPLDGVSAPPHPGSRPSASAPRETTP